MSIARMPFERAESMVDAATAPPVPAPVLAAVPTLTVQRHGRTRRVMELLVAATALAFLIPLFLVLALLVAVTSKGPVLYKQHRIGAGGHPFVIVKFRTMRHGAEALDDELFAQHNDGSGPLNKRHDDPRVTWPGRWMRRYSLDELPQLWNVLTGSMALVGPRPTTPHEVARFTPRDHLRLAVRPGITGVTQVSGRSDLDWDDAVRLDLQYVDNRSLRLDLLILLRTVPAVLGARGAY